MEKCGTAGQTTYGNTIRRMRFTCWITKTTDTHSEYALLLFYANNGYAKKPQCYVTPILVVQNLDKRQTIKQLDTRSMY